jgi:hypothetical protein
LLLLTREQETGIVRNLVVAVLLLRQARRRGRPQEPRCSTSVGGDLRERRGRRKFLFYRRGEADGAEIAETERANDYTVFSFAGWTILFCIF